MSKNIKKIFQRKMQIPSTCYSLQTEVSLLPRSFLYEKLDNILHKILSTMARMPFKSLAFPNVEKFEFLPKRWETKNLLMSTFVSVNALKESSSCLSWHLAFWHLLNHVTGVWLTRPMNKEESSWIPTGITCEEARVERSPLCFVQ